MNLWICQFINHKKLINCKKLVTSKKKKDKEFILIGNKVNIDNMVDQEVEELHHITEM